MYHIKGLWDVCDERVYSWESGPVSLVGFDDISMQSDGVQMWQPSQPVHLWQNENAVSVKVQHTQFPQLTQDLE